MGFPDISFVIPNDIKSTNNKFYLEWFRHLFWDKILHHYFYPIMLKELKINPYAARNLNDELNEIYKNGKIEGLNDATGKIKLAGIYLQVWIETQNEKKLKKLKDFLINNYSGQGVKQGEELIMFFKEKQIKNPDDAIELFIDCFNLIHENVKIGSPIIEKKAHENFTQYYAIFQFNK
jgi:hypothetical protein